LNPQIIDLFQALDRLNLLRRFSFDAHDFIMPAVSNQNDAVSFRRESPCFEMHLRDERARGIA
jgi:UDP-N-acetylmuramyl pentapeptide synthase